eukprot:3157204-Amphidinium_carterae.1
MVLFNRSHVRPIKSPRYACKMPSSIGLCMSISFVGGCLTSSGYNLVPVMKHRAEAHGKAFEGTSLWIFTSFYIILNLAGILMAVIASRFGPVAITMPSVSAAGLLCNMLIQSCSGLKSYNKAMRIGTWALVAAVACLGDVIPPTYYT